MMNMEVIGKFWNVVHDLRPILMMILIQILLAVLIILYKLASEDGMSMKVLTAYRYIFGSATILPLAFFLERKQRPKLTWMVLLQAFTSALFGMSLSQNMYAVSLVLTSTTFAAAISNLVPAITFIMAIFFRLETLGLNSMAGKAKVIGTLASMSGAMVLTIFKGFEIRIFPKTIDLLHKYQQQGGEAVTNNHHQHIDHNLYLGSLLAVASCFSVAFSLMIQTKISVRYPCHYSCTALICAFGALQSVAYALCFERSWNQWKLRWDVRLIASMYAGVVASGVAFPLSLWCVRMRGPLFVSIFNPLVLVLVAIASSLFLKEKLYLGSIVGAAIIICGLYIVIWGKSKEMKKVNQLIPSKSIEEAGLGIVPKLDDNKTIVPINPLAVGSPIILSTDADNNKEILCEIEPVGRGRQDT